MNTPLDEAGGGVPVAGVEETSTPAKASPPSDGGVVKPGGSPTGVTAPDAATEAPAPPPTLRQALLGLCEKYEPMAARNEDVRFGADVVLRAIRAVLATHPEQSPLALHRERLVKLLATATDHVVEWDTDEATGERVAGCFSCASNGYPCRFLTRAADAVLATAVDLTPVVADITKALNRHQPDEYVDDENATETRCTHDGYTWPCADHTAAVTVLGQLDGGST